MVKICIDIVQTIIYFLNNINDLKNLQNTCKSYKNHSFTSYLENFKTSKNIHKKICIRDGSYINKHYDDIESISINVQNFNIIRLTQLINLTELYIGELIRFNIPDCFNQLKNIKVLHTEFCTFSSNSLKNMDQIVDISSKHFTIIQFIYDFTNLEKLELVIPINVYNILVKNTKLSELTIPPASNESLILRGYIQFPQVKKYDTSLYSPRPSIIDVLHYFPNIEEINTSNILQNHSYDFTIFKNLKKITLLNCYALENVFKDFKYLEYVVSSNDSPLGCINSNNLTHLDIMGSYSINNFTNLVELTCNTTMVDDDLKNCHKLKVLNLYKNTNITDKGIGYLKNLTVLKLGDLNCNITDASLLDKNYITELLIDNNRKFKIDLCDKILNTPIKLFKIVIFYRIAIDIRIDNLKSNTVDIKYLRY